MNDPSGTPCAAGPGKACGVLLGSLVLALSGGLAAFPQAAAAAQGGSALFAVGEPTPAPARAKPPSRPKPAKAATRPANKSASTKRAGGKAASGPSRRGKKTVRPSPVALNGRWHDSQCIPLTGVTHRPPLYVKRQYEFVDSSKSWRLDAAVYSSDTCVLNTRMLTYHGDGSFAITGKSKVAGNAYDARFDIARWSATPDNREGVLTLLNSRCGSGDFEEGRSLDLSVTGCRTLGIRPIGEAPREVELVSVSDGKFFLGTRSFVPGVRDDRPAQLSSYGLVRIP